MAKVTLPDQLRHYVGDSADANGSISCVASNYREMLHALDATYPGLGEKLEELAVAIDGQIYQDALLETLNSDSEVFFMPKIEGG